MEGSSHLLSQEAGASDPVWISNSEVLYLKPGENDCTLMMSKHVYRDKEPHMVHHLAGSIFSLKAKLLPGGKVAICCTSVTTPEGEMY